MQVTVLELYDELCALLGKSAKPIFCPERKGDVKHSNADITKAKRLLDYNPEYDFCKGIKMAVNWYRDKL